VRDTLAIAGHQLKLDNIGMNFFPDESLPPVLAHNNRLAQLIFNLINNAAEAIKEKNPAEKENRLITIRTFQEGNRAAAVISDTGIGIPAPIKDRIFEPFFTTKERGKGKGLGLSISNEIVRSYGGRIAVQSEEGKGTVVSVTFPLYERQ
jgi:signal transduction histidine kinase